MKTNRILRVAVIFVILALNIGCDQASKSFVRNTIQMDQQFHYLGKRVMLTRVENSGAFLSVGNSFPTQIKFVVLIAVPMLALMVAMYYLLSQTTLSKSMVVAISCIVGGGFGNIYDRYLYGSVTDFLHVDLIIFRTGIFNMADVSIMVGAIILVVATLRPRNLMDIDAGSPANPI